VFVCCQGSKCVFNRGGNFVGLFDVFKKKKVELTEEVIINRKPCVSKNKVIDLE
jgi:hypothetical protein